MRIRVIAIGTRMPDWVRAGVKEYEKRFPAEWHFTWVELPSGRRTKSAASANIQVAAKGSPAKNRATETKATKTEGRAILTAIGDRETVIALNVSGKSWSTEDLAVQIQTWQMNGQDVCLLIGGADGLSRACLQRANLYWSLSALTLPHPLVRIVLAEQLYRGWTLLNHHPYHR